MLQIVHWKMLASDGLALGYRGQIYDEHPVGLLRFQCSDRILNLSVWVSDILQHRDSTTRFWGPLLCHSFTTITSCCSMIMHGPMLQGSVHNSWKLKKSQFLHGQHTHQTCHSLSMFGMLWISIYDSIVQFMPISSNFPQPLQRCGPTFHRSQSTTLSTICEGNVLNCVRQMVVIPDIYWFSGPPGHTQYSKTANFRVAFYCGQPKAHLCNNHAV